MNLAELKTKLRDLWRGYSEDDVDSLLRKLAEDDTPGGVVPITRREYKALRAGRADTHMRVV